MPAYKRICKLIIMLLLCLFPVLAFGTETAKEGTLFPPVQRDILQRLDLPFDKPAVHVENGDIILTNLGLFRELGVSEDQFTEYKWSGDEWFPVKQHSADGEERIVLISGESVVKKNNSQFLNCLLLFGDSSADIIMFIPGELYADAEGEETIQESWSIRVNYQSGTSAIIRADGVGFRFVVDDWQYVLEYGADDWLISSIVRPVETEYPDFRYRLDHWGTQYEWNAYFENGIGYSSISTSPWYNYENGNRVEEPEELHLEEIWPFRVIAPDGEILAFSEHAVKSSPIKKVSVHPDASWLDPPEMTESVFQMQPFSFPEFPQYVVVHEQDGLSVKFTWPDASAWGILPDQLRTWTFDPQSEEWTVSGEPTDNSVTLIIPQNGLPSEEDEDFPAEAIWTSGKPCLPELKELALLILYDRERVWALEIRVDLSEKDISYQIDADLSGPVIVRYRTDSSTISAEYDQGELSRYSVYKRTDSYRLEYTYQVADKDEVLSAVYYWEMAGDGEARDCILQGEKWFRFTDEGMEETDVSDLVDLCQVLPIIIQEE